MFSTNESINLILCGITTYLVVAPLFIITAGLCGWLVRQYELADQPAEAGNAASPAVPGNHAPAVTAANEPRVATAA